jgi:hypothetical protein
MHTSNNLFPLSYKLIYLMKINQIALRHLVAVAPGRELTLIMATVLGAYQFLLSTHHR